MNDVTTLIDTDSAQTSGRAGGKQAKSQSKLVQPLLQQDEHNVVFDQSFKALCSLSSDGAC